MNRTTILSIGAVMSLGMLVIAFLIYTDHGDDSAIFIAILGPMIASLTAALAGEQGNREIRSQVREVQHQVNGQLTKRLDDQTRTIVTRIKEDN